MFGDRLKLARKKTGYSLRDLADALKGEVTAQAIGKYELNTAVARASLLGVTTHSEGKHSVKFWADLLIAHRAQSQAPGPLGAALQTTLRSSASAVHDCWWIEMRYKRGYSSRTDLERVAAAVDWIDKSYTILYT